APDAFGRGEITTSNGDSFAYYLVTPKVLRIVETDTNFTTGGSAYAQASVATVNNASLTGKFVFGALGQSPVGGTAFAGQLTTDGAGNITAGIADAVTADGGGVNPAIDLTGNTYSFAGSPRGSSGIINGSTFQVYLIDPTVNILDPTNAAGGGGALIVETDA